MAEKLCTLRTKGGGGGKYTETSLWTNPSPTSNFASQSVSLSESMDNFKYIGIKYKRTTAATDSITVIILVSEFKLATDGSTNYHIGLGGNNTNTYTRRCDYQSNTNIGFANAARIGASGTDNSVIIPLEILGLNELDHGTKSWDSGVIPANADTTTKITLGYKPKILILRYYKNTSNMIDNVYTDSISTSTYQRWVYSGSASMANRTLPQGTGNSRCITSIDNDGFTAGPNDDSTYTCYYWAIGEA